MTAEATETPEETPEPTPEPEPAADETSTDRLPDDHPVVKALAKANEEAKQYRLKVKEFEDAEKTDQERLAEELEAAKAEGSSAKAEAAKLRAAIKHGLSEGDLDLLAPGTPEEIEERAEKLAARIGTSEEPVVPPSPNQGGEGGTDVDPDKLAADILSSGF